MKVLAIILLCAFAAVQGRSTAIANRKDQPELGDVPYIIHLRIAVGSSGSLGTAAGSLISPNYVLTAANALQDSRFIWIRFGALQVIYPSLVLESNAVTSHGVIALIDFTRYVHSTPNIAPVVLGGGDVSKVETFCSYGEDCGKPGEVLSCYEAVAAETDGGISVTVDDAATTRFDIGAPLVAEDVQIAILVEDEKESRTFLPIGDYLDWIEGVTGVQINTPAPPSSESSEDVTKPDEKSSESTEDVSKPDEKSSESTEDVSKPDEKSSESTEDVSKPDEKSSESTEDVSKPDEKSSESKEDVSKPDEKSSESNEKSSESNEKSSESNEKSSESDEKSSESDDKSSESSKDDSSSSEESLKVKFVN